MEERVVTRAEMSTVRKREKERMRSRKGRRGDPIPTKEEKIVNKFVFEKMNKSYSFRLLVEDKKNSRFRFSMTRLPF